MPIYSPLGDEITLAPVALFHQNQPRITALASGGYVVVWTRVTDTANQTGGDVVGQLFDAQGNPTDDAFYLTVGQGPVHENTPTVTALVNGGFVASWNGGFQVFSDTGQKVGSLGSAGGEVVANPNGGFDLYRAAGTQGILVRSYNDGGNEIAPAFSVPQLSPTQRPVDPAFAHLTGGGFAVAFWYDDPTNVDPENPFTTPYLELRTYNSAGTLLTTQNWGAYTSSPEIVALPGGGFVMVWTDDLDVAAQRFDAAGNKVGGEIEVATYTDGIQRGAKVTTLAAGGFVVTWYDGSGSGGDGNGEVKAQVFDGSGNKVGTEFLVNAASELSEAYLDVTELANGDLVFSWARENSPSARDVIISRVFHLDPMTAPAIDGDTGNNTLHGTALSETINGLAGADVIYGHGGQDVLNGHEGNDYLVSQAKGNGAATLNGGDGDDALLVYLGDTVIEAVGGGYDNVAAYAEGYDFQSGTRAYVLNAGAEVEVLSTTNHGGNVTFNLTGNEFGQIILGNASPNILDGGGGADTMHGFGGDDTYIVDSADDRVFDTSGPGDTIRAKVTYAMAAGVEVEILRAFDPLSTASLNFFGNELGQQLIGNAGANYLDGGGGADVLDGGAGDDAIIVDADDQVVEGAGGGHDNVAAKVSYVLTAAAQVEVLSTTDHGGTAAIDLTGNAFNQTLIGNAGANRLDAGGGADLLVGFGGNDVLVVDSLDRVLEAIGGGTDRVEARSSFVLEAGQEIEQLATINQGGTATINITGNAFSQTLTGNAGSNYLDGGGGTDILTGLGGNDTYIVDADDQIVEASGGGFENVAAKVSYALAAGQEIEVFSTTDHGGTAAIDLTGNAFSQTVIGNAGANILDGKGGNDLILGFGGADTFAFTTALGAGNVDTISDFVSGTDRIALDDAVFAGLAPGALPAGAFVTGPAALDADDRIIYDSATGRLYYDADGNGAGAQVQFATLTGAPALTAGDFTVI